VGKPKKKPPPTKDQKRIDFSQTWTEYKIKGQYFERIPVGEETFNIEIEDNRCFLCYAEVTMLHQLGCEAECSAFSGRSVWLDEEEAYEDDE
jgi:hypothetical protein